MGLFRKKRNGSGIINNKEFYSSLKSIVGFRPGNLYLYEKAFIHRSASQTLPAGNRINNERLEYLGDAILDAVLSEYLFVTYPEYDEGTLTKIRSRLVNRDQLNSLAKSIGLESLVVSHINKSHPSKHLYGDALEALIGAIFIDRGYEGAQKFILGKLMKGNIDLKKIVVNDTDFKSQVFQWAQKLRKQINFNYNEDYDYTGKCTLFTSTLRIDHEIFGEGTGLSKREAEQAASLKAWEKIRKIGFIE